MEKALKMGKTSATGSFQLLLGIAVSYVIMAIGTIILQRLLGPAGYGLYTIALIPSITISLFRDWGIDSAMTKYIASLRVENKDEEIRNVIVVGLVFEVVTGLALSFVSLVLASLIASVMFHRPGSVFAISIISMVIFSGALFTVAQSSFVGFERMELYSFTIVCQSIVKTVAGPMLVLLGYSVLGAAIGYTLSFIAVGIIGLATLYFILFRPLRKQGTNSFNLSKTLKTMLRFGVPLAISSILGGILVQFYFFMIAFYASDAMIGNYQAAVNFSIFLTIFTIPISTVLFPAFAKLDPQKENKLVKTVFASSIKYTAIILVPATAAVMALSGPLISTLSGQKYAYAPFLLTIYVIGNLFAVLGSLSSGSLLSGLGETKMLMKQSIVTLSIGLPLGFLLIPTLGVIGLIIANTFAGLPSMFWGLYWIWKHCQAKADFQSSAKILLASAIAALAAYLPVSLLNTADWIKLTVGVIIFLVVYIFGAPIIGAVSQTDINNLRAMLSGMGFISKIINIPLSVAEKAAQISFTKQNET
jgi:stage V sporulation protein B